MMIQIFYMILSRNAARGHINEKQRVVLNNSRQSILVKLRRNLKGSHVRLVQLLQTERLKFSFEISKTSLDWSPML